MTTDDPRPEDRPADHTLYAVIVWIALAVPQTVIPAWGIAVWLASRGEKLNPPPLGHKALVMAVGVGLLWMLILLAGSLPPPTK